MSAFKITGIIFLYLLIAASIAFSAIVYAQHFDACEVAPAAAAKEATTHPPSQGLVMQHRDTETLSFPTFLLSTTSPFINKILSYSPVSGGAVTGLRTRPYASLPNTGGSLYQAVSSVGAPGSEKILQIIRTSSTSAVYRYYEESLSNPNVYEETSSLTNAAHFSSNPFGTVSGVQVGSGYIMINWTNTTTGARIVYFSGEEENITPTVLGTFTALSNSAPQLLCIKKISSADPPSFAAVYARSTSIEAVAFTLDSGTNPTTLTNLSATRQIISVVSTGLDSISIGATETDLTFVVNIHGTGNVRVYRYPLTWSGAGGAALNAGTVPPGITTTWFGFSPIASSGAGNNVRQSVQLSDGKMIMALGVGGKSNARSNRFILFSPETGDSYTALSPTTGGSYGVNDILILAHDPTDDTMFLSWVETPTRLKIAFAKYSALDSRLDILDEVVREGSGAIVDGCIVQKDDGRYVFSNYWGQIIPIWVSSTRNTMSFHPTRGRKPIGFIGEEGRIYAPGSVVAVSENVHAGMIPGQPVFCDDEGTLTKSNPFGQGVQVGYFTGDPDHLMFSWTPLD